ncbi:hypothetical protein LP418_13065 [Nocardioides sp. B-3]|nr:hypothetical protein [Nocardioides sp. B-3]UUZ61414.1 hypothetical protein LP418_13065 [Nocardioides sp. B-3]
MTDRHPTLARLQPGRRVRATDDHDEDQSLDRGNIFAAVHDLFETLAEAGPLLVVVEDTHWADQSTRDMLSFLFSRPFAGPVALVVSYRSDDLHRRHPLRPRVAEWARLRGVERLRVEPLSDGDVRRLVYAMHKFATITEASVAEIVDRAEGNAFFVEELVGATRATGGQIPTELADVLLVRLDRLDERTLEVVRVASVAGRHVSHELLAAVTGLGAAELEGALRSAVESNVLAQARGSSYAFRHALPGEAVYDDLLPGERARLHTSFMEALQSGRVVGTAGELALHARRAGDRLTAAVASIEAGNPGLRGRRSQRGGHAVPGRVEAARRAPRRARRHRPARARAPVRGGVHRGRPGVEGRDRAPLPPRLHAGRRLRDRPWPDPDGNRGRTDDDRHHRRPRGHRGRGRRAAGRRAAQAVGPCPRRARAVGWAAATSNVRVRSRWRGWRSPSATA